MRTELVDLLPIPDPPLPSRKSIARAFDLDSLQAKEGSILHTLLAQMQAASAEAAAQLQSLCTAFVTEQAELVARWQSNAPLNALLDEVAGLPAAAATGHPKLKGIVPTSIGTTAARTYCALLLLIATRHLFLAEHRGLDAIVASTESRRASYQPFLAQEYLLLIDGFPRLYSILQSQAPSEPAQVLANSIAYRIPHEARTFVAMCVAYELLTSCGRGGHAQSQGLLGSRAA